MAANTTPIFGLTGVLGTTRITAQQANAGRSDGGGTVGTDVFKAATGGTNGTFVKEIRVKAAATAAATNTTATSIRVYASTVGSGATTSADTKLIGEFAIPVVSAANISAPSPDFCFPVNFVVPSGSFLHVGSGAALAANTEFHATAIGMDY